MNLSKDMRSKLLDGMLAFILPTLGMFALIFSFRFVKQFGAMGYWGYAVIILPVSIWLLRRSLETKRSEIARAWYGIWGGFSGWTFTELGHTLGFLSIEDWDGIFLLVLVGALTFVLWTYLPLGARFWATIFELNWLGHMVILMQKHIFGTGAALQTPFLLTAIICGAVLLGLLYWLFTKTTRRLQRMWCGIGMWIMLVIIMFVFKG